MYQQTTLNFRIKKWLHPHSGVIGMFLEDWIDGTTRDYEWNIPEWNGGQPASFAVIFSHREDAIALKLRGVPPQFKEFFELQ